MRRGTSGGSNGEQTPRFCPNCGAANTSLSLRCTICGQPFGSDAKVASYWSTTPAQSTDEQSFIDLYSDDSDRFAPTEEPPSPAAPTTPFTPTTDPWSSSAGRLGGGPGEGFVPPCTPPSKRREGGPPGFVLGCFGLLLILIVAVATIALVARPFLAEQVEDSAGEAIESALAEATLVPDLTAGTVVITESQINRTLRSRADDFDPVEDPRVQIRRSGIEATFTIYGIDAKLTGKVGVEEGRIMIQDSKLDDPAGRIIDVDTIVEDAENAINSLLARNNLRATSAITTDDTLTITTEPAT
jgi:hypothetical protein